MHATALVYGCETAFNLLMAFEGLDGPLVLRFDDDSRVDYEIGGVDALDLQWEVPASSTWSDASGTGSAQQRLEAVSTLIELSGVGELFDPEDQLLLEAVKALLAALARDQRPPRSLAEAALRWLGQKIDRFVDEAATTSGRAVGILGGAGLGMVAVHYFPQLGEMIKELTRLAER